MQPLALALSVMLAIARPPAPEPAVVPPPHPIALDVRACPTEDLIEHIAGQLGQDFVMGKPTGRTTTVRLRRTDATRVLDTLMQATGRIWLRLPSGPRTVLVMVPAVSVLVTPPPLTARDGDVTVMLKRARFRQVMRIVCKRAGYKLDFDLRHDPELSANVSEMPALDFVRVACLAAGVQLEEDGHGGRLSLRFRN